MLAMLAAWAAKSVLMQSPVGGVLRGAGALSGKLPWQLWAGIFAAIALWLGIRWHAHEVHKTYVSGYNQAKAAAAAALKPLRDKAVTATTEGKAIAADIRSRNDATVRDIHVAAAGLGVRGPGAASCRQLDHPAVSAAGGRSQPPGRAGDAALPAVPVANGPELVAMPWDQAIAYGEQHDGFRAEALSWRSWYQQQSAAWARLKAPDRAAPSTPTEAASGDKPPHQ